ncbi:MAG: DNA internalization-related competence protein ComEC/Rec2 [Pseudomonadales bacterium]|nr:DNA internalization-related competence protein ComEC/Rec2 [Pseudomonadales bacterium]
MTLVLPWPALPGSAAATTLATAALGCMALLLGRSAVPAGTTAGGAGQLRARPAGAWLAGAAGLLAGIAWSVAEHRSVLDARVGSAVPADAVRLEVIVASQPVTLEGPSPERTGIRFEADVSTGPEWALGRRLRLTWYAPEPVGQGERWRFAVAVRAPLGNVNPGGFDFERWLVGQRIHGTGSVRRGTRLTAAAPGWIERQRVALTAFVAAQELASGGVLTALMVGAGGAIAPDLWEVFRATGTVHLMVISGLHIGLAVGLGYGAGQMLARLCPPLLLWIDARKAGACLGALAGLGYTLVSGAGVPAQRACIMAAPALLMLAWGRRGQAGGLLWLALAGVLLADPLAIHQQGFWLSFGAVALLVIRFGSGRRRGGRLAGFLRAQWSLTVFLAPLLLLVTGRQPLAALGANLVAVPLVSLVLVPLTLAGGLLAGVWPALAAVALTSADAVFGWLLAILSVAAMFPSVNAEPTRWTAVVGLAGAIAWLWSGAGRERLLLALAVGVMLLGPMSRIPFGAFRVTAFDVGQGDAILVDTARHRLLFDTGPGFPGGRDAGATVVRPGLLATGRRYLDVLVLSHADLDHVGGLAGLEEGIAIGRVYASFDHPGAELCEAQAWDWDGVRFSFVAVPRAGPGQPLPDGNDRSCILLVEAGDRRALLTGDIGARVEAHLLRHLAQPVDLLQAPHHGSAGSSSRAFVRTLRPAHVLVSAGFGNRYGHPHPRVLENYRAVGATVHQTALAGALTWESQAPETVSGWRAQAPAYWRTPVASTAGN